MKRISLIIITIIATSTIFGRIIPEDGQKQWRWAIDASMPENSVAGQLVDLSDATVTDAFETYYRVYGDTLVCRYLPGVRDWFVLRDGSLWTVGANDRITRHAYTHGVMYRPSDSGSCQYATTDTLTVSSIDSEPARITVRSTLSIVPGPGFILALGDTVFSTVEVRELNVRTDSAGSSATFSDRRWYAAGCTFPVVEETGTMSGGKLHATLTVCPPSEQPGTGGPKSRGDGSFGAPPRLGDNGGDCTDIIRQGGLLSAGSGDISISVCDIQGRVLRTGTGSVPTEGLPPGWYIITTSGDTGDTSVKFRID